MTIKRRLQISNILMLAIPTLMTSVINLILIFIITKVLNIQDFEALNENAAILGIIPPVIIVVVIPFTNKFLTRFVINKITSPLEILSQGVHQIRDGNLSYQIEYNEKDEFADICSDFNEMAKRLNELVTQRQQDETNRRELIAGISHDLRTPLTSIKAYVEGLEKGVATTPELQRRYLAIVKDKTNELERIVNQLFLFSKIDIGDFPFYFEKIDIVDELHKLVESLAEEYDEKGLTVSLLRTTQNIYVRLDAQQFHNAIVNILENSLKYKEKERGRIEIQYRTDGNNVVIKLRDDGPGVPEETLCKLFDTFYRVDASRGESNKGSGLGLAITAKTLERMGGSIRAENAEGSGLVSVITLPILRGGNNEKDTNY